MTIKIRATAQTHPGMVLKNNEDAYLVDNDLGFYAVADGVGGQADGEVASRMAVEVTRAYFAQHTAEIERLRNSPPALARAEGAALVGQAIQEACRAIHQIDKSG